MKRIALVLWVWVPVACGGSSSETPFPQAPVDPQLQARHDAVLAESSENESPETPAVTPAATAKPTTTSAPGTSVSPSPASAATAAPKN